VSVVNYDIGQIMDALAATFNNVATGDTINGVPVTIECKAEVPDEIQPPSLVLELDSQTFDLNMGSGADSLSVVALALVQYQDAANAQRALWSFLSRKTTSGVARLKAALEANQTLGGLVSYAIMTQVRSPGIVEFNRVQYLGAEIVIEVVS